MILHVLFYTHCKVSLCEIWLGMAASNTGLLLNSDFFYSSPFDTIHLFDRNCDLLNNVKQPL